MLNHSLFPAAPLPPQQLHNLLSSSSLNFGSSSSSSLAGLPPQPPPPMGSSLSAAALAALAMGGSNAGSGMSTPNTSTPRMPAQRGVPSVDPYLTAVVIKNIPFAMKEDELMTKIRERGFQPTALNYHRDNTNIFRGVAFANFSSVEETNRAINELSGLLLLNRPLRVEPKKRVIDAPPTDPTRTPEENRSTDDFFRQTLREFVADDIRRTLEFPENYTNYDRRKIHFLAEKEFKLGHYSEGNVDHRRIVISKDIPAISAIAKASPLTGGSPDGSPAASLGPVTGPAAAAAIPIDMEKEEMRNRLREVELKLASLLGKPGATGAGQQDLASVTGQWPPSSAPLSNQPYSASSAPLWSQQSSPHWSPHVSIAQPQPQLATPQWSLHHTLPGTSLSPMLQQQQQQQSDVQWSHVLPPLPKPSSSPNLYQQQTPQGGHQRVASQPSMQQQQQFQQQWNMQRQLLQQQQQLHQQVQQQQVPIQQPQPSQFGQSPYSSWSPSPVITSTTPPAQRAPGRRVGDPLINPSSAVPAVSQDVSVERQPYGPDSSGGYWTNLTRQALVPESTAPTDAESWSY